MLAKKNTLNRSNTYLPREYFKVIVISSSESQAEEAAEWLTQSTFTNQGVYSCPYNNSQMIVFLRWPETANKQTTTVAVEALLIFAEDTEELKFIIPEIRKYGNIPVRLIVSEEDLSKEALDLKMEYFPIDEDDDSETLKNKLDEMDREQLQMIKKVFSDFDSDASGFIELEEMKKIAISFGEDSNSEDFRQSMLALDFNEDNNISFTEFVAWWKIGRQNTLTLPKIYQLKKLTKEFVTIAMNFPNYFKQISEIIKVDDTKSIQKIKFRSPGMFKPKTFVEFGVAVGGSMKTQMAVDFFSQFTKQTSLAKSNWMSIIITLNEKQNNLDPSSAKRLLEDFKENVMKWGEVNANPIFVSFVKNLMLFEYNSNNKNIILVSRLKLDIEELVKGAIHPILYIIQNLSLKQESSWFNLETHSNCDLYENINNKITLGDYLKISEFSFEGSTFRNRLKALFDCLNPEFQRALSFLKFLFLPHELDLEFDGDINEFNDEQSRALLATSLEKFVFILDFLKKNISSELLSASNNFEIGMNIFDVFARIKFNCKSVFSKNI